jgi:uncharacterized protein (TIGR03083 family)
MTTSGTPDYAGAYREVRTDVIGLLKANDDGRLDERAPATPEWRVRDVAAHLAGVCDDIVNGRMHGVATDAWTAAQVATRTEWDVDRLVTDWVEHATVVEAQMNDWGPGMGQMVFDAFTHGQDIRGALGVPGARDSSAAEISFDWMVPNLRAPADIDPEDPRLRPPIHVVTETTEVDIVGPPGGPSGTGTTLRISRFEFLRSVTGRRSRRQIEAYDWTPAPRVDDLCSNEVFRPAALDILE